MNKKKLKSLFSLAEQLYEEERKKAGISVLPYCFAKNENTGGLLIYSNFGEKSKEIEQLLKRAIL
jgi:hypothetical protein